jgi:hypothetical protein
MRSFISSQSLRIRLTRTFPGYLALINRPLQTSVVVPQNQSNRGVPTNRASDHCQHSLHSPRKVLFNNEVKGASEKAELFNRKEDFRLNALNCGLQLRPKELSMMAPFPSKSLQNIEKTLKSIVSKKKKHAQNHLHPKFFKIVKKFR